MGADEVIGGVLECLGIATETGPSLKAILSHNNS